MGKLLNFLDRVRGRRCLVLLLVCALTACTTLHTAPVSGSELQDRIRSGTLVGPGDVVRVRTATDRTPEFELTAVERDYLVGEDVRIPIDTITGLEIRDHGQAKKTARTVGMVVLTIAVLCAAVFLFASESMSGFELSPTGG